MPVQHSAPPSRRSSFFWRRSAPQPSQRAVSGNFLPWGVGAPARIPFVSPAPLSLVVKRKATTTPKIINKTKEPSSGQRTFGPDAVRPCPSNDGGLARSSGSRTLAGRPYDRRLLRRPAESERARQRRSPLPPGSNRASGYPQQHPANSRRVELLPDSGAVSAPLLCAVAVLCAAVCTAAAALPAAIAGRGA
ncbi:MAG: hypothetical protein BJ554DRAFT_6599, partial [Olpidium bornovanus]